MDQSQVTQNRRSRRSPVLLAASIDAGGRPVAVRLRNLSEEGALIESSELPAEGTPVLFQRKDLRVSGRVVWVQGRYAGIAFDARLNRDEALRYVPRPKPKAPVEFRRPGFACRPLTAHDREMLEVWMATSQLGLIED